MKRITFILILLFIISNLLSGQTPFNVKGQIKWCNNNFISAEIMINLLVYDSVAQTSFTDKNGNFTFHDFLTTNNYLLRISYYGLNLDTIQIKCDFVSQNSYIDKIYSICCTPISDHIKDSLMLNWNKKIKTIYYYGMPAYSDNQIFLYSRKYGLKYENLGCVVRSDENEMNINVKSYLISKLGKNWEEILWNEICRNLDK